MAARPTFLIGVEVPPAKDLGEAKRSEADLVALQLPALRVVEAMTKCCKRSFECQTLWEFV